MHIFREFLINFIQINKVSTDFLFIHNKNFNIFYNKKWIFLDCNKIYRINRFVDHNIEKL